MLKTCLYYKEPFNFFVLFYESEFVFGYTQCWFLLNDNHYDVISIAKGFLACKYFSDKCCSCCTHGDAFEKHSCAQEVNEEIKERVRCETGPLCKDAGHFIKRAICEESDDEIAFKLFKCKDKSQYMKEQIIKETENPRYVVYDFETDTSTNIHRPSLCEVCVFTSF